MSFLAGDRLWILAGVVALTVAYVIVQISRRRYAVRFTNVDLLASVAPRRPGWRRHLAATALLLALTSLVVAFARPTRPIQVPREAATVMLAIDVSQSMAATDVRPSRIQAAEKAVSAFVTSLPSRFRIGLVSFAGTATVLVPPTTDRALVGRAVDSLQLQTRTAIGEGIYASLDAIKSAPADNHKTPPARILLLSDGATNAGRSNQDAEQAALKAKVPVSTIAFGTQGGSVVVDDQQVDVPADRDSLRQIADTTHGRFSSAASISDLKRIYSDLGSAIAHVTRQREITTWFVGVGLAFALAAAGASLVWTSRLP